MRSFVWSAEADESSPSQVASKPSLAEAKSALSSIFASAAAAARAAASAPVVNAPAPSTRQPAPAAFPYVALPSTGACSTAPGRPAASSAAPSTSLPADTGGSKPSDSGPSPQVQLGLQAIVSFVQTAFGDIIDLGAPFLASIGLSATRLDVEEALLLYSSVFEPQNELLAAGRVVGLISQFDEHGMMVPGSKHPTLQSLPKLRFASEEQLSNDLLRRADRVLLYIDRLRAPYSKRAKWIVGRSQLKLPLSFPVSEPQDPKQRVLSAVLAAHGKHEESEWYELWVRSWEDGTWSRTRFKEAEAQKDPTPYTFEEMVKETQNVAVAVLYLRQPVRGLAAAAARPSAATFSREGRLLRILLTPGDGNCGIWALLLALLRFLAQLDATHPGRGRAEFEELVRRLVPGLPDHELERWWAIALELKRRLPSTAEESLQLVAPLRPLVAAVRRSVAEQLRAEARQHLSNAERELTAGKIARRAWEQRRKQVFDKQARANKVEQEGEYLWDDEVTKAARALNVGLRIATRNAPAVEALALPGRPYIVVM